MPACCRWAGSRPLPSLLRARCALQCKGEGGTCPDGDSSCCASTRFCAGPAYTCAGCRAEGDPCGTDAECCPGAPYCSQGVCSPCKALGDTCSDYGQCCQHVGYCSQASYMCKQAGCLGQSDADLSGRARGCCWAAGTRASCSVAATSTLACPSPLRHLQCKGAGAACSGHTECCADPKNSYCTNNKCSPVGVPPGLPLLPSTGLQMGAIAGQGRHMGGRRGEHCWQHLSAPLCSHQQAPPRRLPLPAVRDRGVRGGCRPSLGIRIPTHVVSTAVACLER